MAAGPSPLPDSEPECVRVKPALEAQSESELEPPGRPLRASMIIISGGGPDGPLSHGPGL
jgi:hypothetical protein